MEHKRLCLCRGVPVLRIRLVLASSVIALAVCSAAASAPAQVSVTASVVRQSNAKTKREARPLPPAVLWLVPLQHQTLSTPEPAHGPYVLRQKNRTFEPHVLVVPVGTPVSFPNSDPFFHNVFSLYNGKRFDLGLYEKGASRQVVFSREGVSYIFCNIHPEMSAVVIALRTPWWARADDSGALAINNVPPGEYEAHLWVEGVDPHQLDAWTHRVHLTSGSQNVGSLAVDPDTLPRGHANKFGQPYHSDPHPY